MFRVIICVLCIIFLASGCINVYIPNTHNVPLHKEKNEFKIAAHAGFNGMSYLTSYSLTDKLAIMFNFARFRSVINNENETNHLLAEGGIGYYKRIGEYGVFETFIGGGAGSGKASGMEFFNNRFIEASGQYFRYMSQISLGAEIENVAIGIAIRPVYVQYYRYSSTRNEVTNPGSLFIEPAFFFRFGWDFVKLESLLGFSIPASDIPEFDFLPVFISLGIHINASGLRKAINSSNN